MGLVVYHSSFRRCARGKHLAKADRTTPAGHAHIVIVLPVADEMHMLHDCPGVQPHRQHQNHNVDCLADPKNWTRSEAKVQVSFR